MPGGCQTRMLIPRHWALSRQFLSGATILVPAAGAGFARLEDHAVLVEHGTILAVMPRHEATPGETVALPPGTLLAPGLIDIQVNGGGGILFNDRPDVDAARAIAAAHRHLGTTSILPTLITDTAEAMHAAAGAALAVCEPGGAIPGIHFEGPFLSPRRPGVHRVEYVRSMDKPDAAFLVALAQQLAGTVLLTLAPECVEPVLLEQLSAAGVVLSAGHTAATYEQAMGAAAHGVSAFTHLFNAMPAIASRDPGPVAAALELEQAYCGLIADGIHVHPAMLRLVLARKRPDRVVLVSDAMPPAGTDVTSFTLQGRTIHRRNGRLETEDGILSGADLSLLEAVRRVVALCGVPPEQALAMASMVPAMLLRQDHLMGSIAPGRRANLVLLTPGLEPLGTWLGGVWDGRAGVLGGAGVRAA